MNECDEKTVKLLQNLIENLNAGHISTVSRDGNVLNDGAVVTLIFNGTPEIAPSA